MRNVSVFRQLEYLKSEVRHSFFRSAVFASLLLAGLAGGTSAFAENTSAVSAEAVSTGNAASSEDNAASAEGTVSAGSNVSEESNASAEGTASVSAEAAGISADAASSSKAEADRLYQENNFTGAIEIYESILSSGMESADIYYNLGNSYYKNKNMAKAVLNYERALLLSPGDDDIRYNLEMAKSKTVDKITPKREVFIVTWINGIRDVMSESAWARASIFCFIVFLLSVSAYIFGNKIVIKKIGFSLAVIFLVFTIAGNMFADAQKDKLVNRSGAIIMNPSVTVKSTPDDSGTDLFVLHEGTKVFIDDNSMKGWKEVCLEDGSKGWVPATSIEQI